MHLGDMGCFTSVQNLDGFLKQRNSSHIYLMRQLHQRWMIVSKSFKKAPTHIQTFGLLKKKTAELST